MFVGGWRALGSETTICLPDASEAEGREHEEWIKKYLGGFESRFSRFIPTSELCLLNAATGQWTRVSPEMIEMLRIARILHFETEGIFDPCILPALERAGYEKSFYEERGDHAGADLYDKRAVPVKISFGAVEIDDAAGAIRLPSGARVDLGGIGKGFAADHVAEYLGRYYRNFWVSLGGDMRLIGGDYGKSWRVGAQDPSRHSEDVGDILITGKLTALATSGITKRRFQSISGQATHHIIDPRTGEPTADVILAATALADTATRADVLAKTALILGARSGIELIDGLNDAECLLIDKNKNIHYSAGMPKLLAK